MDQENWLADYISCAFAGVMLGSGLDLYSAQCMDDCGNPEDTLLANAAERNDWRLVPLDHLFSRVEALAYLDPLGFRFYTPAIMTALLVLPMPSGECLTDSFLSHIKISVTGTVKGVPFNTLFTVQQRAAMIRFLKYLIFNRGHVGFGTEAGKRLIEIRTRTN